MALGRDRVAVMQTTESRQRDNVVARRRDIVPSTIRSVLLESEMSSVLVVIAHVVFQQPSEMPLVENDHVVEQVPPDTANPALRNSVLPWTAKCSPNRLRANGLHRRNDIRTELRVAIKDQETMRLLAIFPCLV